MKRKVSKRSVSKRKVSKKYSRKKYKRRKSRGKSRRKSRRKSKKIQRGGMEGAAGAAAAPPAAPPAPAGGRDPLSSDVTENKDPALQRVDMGGTPIVFFNVNIADWGKIYVEDLVSKFTDVYIENGDDPPYNFCPSDRRAADGSPICLAALLAVDEWKKELEEVQEDYVKIVRKPLPGRSLLATGGRWGCDIPHLKGKITQAGHATEPWGTVLMYTDNQSWGEYHSALAQAEASAAAGAGLGRGPAGAVAVDFADLK